MLSQKALKHNIVQLFKLFHYNPFQSRDGRSRRQEHVNAVICESRSGVVSGAEVVGVFHRHSTVTAQGSVQVTNVSNYQTSEEASFKIVIYLSSTV